MVTELRSIAIRAAAALVLLTSLSGCTVAGHDFTPPGFFDEVNDVVEVLDIPSLDGLVREGRSGIGGNNPPLYTAAVEGQDALPELQERLADAGYVSNGLLEKSGRETWTPSNPSDEFVEVRLHPLVAGDGVAFGRDKDFTMKRDGLVIWVLG
ncbi:hypothetical protein GCM10027413_29430 [Conyzicola nivalis]|uniref:Uncharacterized protein n=1 Tax=Conyzicola nivalis TaxID=1477021 RepID=A0A916WMY3_9MICO|nr:hypothetical protein [Conyzicola nivalis]GGB13603.1 hypothetical protein GCM10010979_30080 [Conyzicola nivalis]